MFDYFVLLFVICLFSFVLLLSQEVGFLIDEKKKERKLHDCFASSKHQDAAHSLSQINHLFQLFCKIVSQTGAFYFDGLQIVVKMKGFNISKLSDHNSSCEPHTWASYGSVSFKPSEI